MNSGPQHHTKVSLCQLSLCLPVTCIPFINTLLEMLKQRPEGLSQGLPTLSGKAAEDPLALCFPRVPLFPEPPGAGLASPAPGRDCSAHSSHSTGHFPGTVLGGLLPWTQVLPAPGSGHRVLKHHCTAQLGASHPAQAGVPQHLRSCLTSLGLQYPGKWIYCSGSKDKPEIKK